MKKLVMHIPHSSAKIPFDDCYVLPKVERIKEVLKLTDWYTDDIFQSDSNIIVKADFSRLFCDPERFVNDEDEVMAQYGMGVLYETTDEGLTMRKVSPEIREKIIKEFYVPHHEKLSGAVKSQLDQEGKALIIDCHSFTDQPFKRDLDKSPNRPDICIGTDDFHTPKNLIDFSIEYFQSHGLSVKVNSPYSGTIVPLEYYHNDDRVLSIMIEINRKLYLIEGDNTKSSNFEKIKSIIQEYLSELKTN